MYDSQVDRTAWTTITHQLCEVTQKVLCNVFDLPCQNHVYVVLC